MGSPQGDLDGPFPASQKKSPRSSSMPAVSLDDGELITSAEERDLSRLAHRAQSFPVVRRSSQNRNQDDSLQLSGSSIDLELAKTLHLSFMQKVLGGSGHILNDACASMWFSYLLLYLESVVGLSGDYAAGLMLFGQVVDGLSTPLIGYEIDRVSYCFLCRRGYGRCKSWHLVGVILVVFSFPFVFSPCIGCTTADHWAKVIYYAPFIAIFQIGWASNQISHLALIPKLSPDDLIRTEVLAIRYAFTIAANITIFLMVGITLGFSSTCEIGPTDASNFMYIAFAAVGIGLFFSILFHVFVREHSDERIKKAVAAMNSQSCINVRPATARHNIVREDDEMHATTTNIVTRRALRSNSRNRIRTPELSGNSSEEEVEQSLLDNDDDDNNANRSIRNSQMPQADTLSEAPSVKVLLPVRRLSTRMLTLGRDTMSTKDWLTLPQFYIVAAVYMATRLSINVTQVYMPLYISYSLKLPCLHVAMIPLTMYIAGFVVSIIIKPLNKWFGRQISYTIGATLCVIGSACILYLDWTPGGFMHKYGIYMVAVLLGGGASAILITSLSITADMIGNNVENGAFVYGSMSFTDKLSCGIVIMLINSVMPCDSPKNPDCNISLVPYYSNVLGYSCGGCALLGALACLALTYRIHLQNKNRHHLIANEVFSEPDA